MKLEYRSANLVYADDRVTSIAGDGSSVMVFTSDYGPSQHKYLITGSRIRRYDLTSSFFIMLPIQTWRIAV